jgi:hypothetical protein
MRWGTFFLTIAALLLVGPENIAAEDPGLPLERDDGDFTFVRLVYTGDNWRGSNWATDYPKADLQFLYAVRKMTDFSFIGSENRALSLTSEELFEYPFLYAVEVGHMRLSNEEVATLREYLLRGGFLVVDDFHGEWEWMRFYSQIKRVFPEFEPEILPLSHPVFHCYFDIKELIQVPGLQYLYSGRTWEKGGRQPRYMGIHDEQGRLMVMINHNVDFGDAWEWAEVEEYPREYARLAFQLGVNYIVYSMTH